MAIRPRTALLIGSKAGRLQGAARTIMLDHQASLNNSARLKGRPERIFVSVDQSTNRSTISFQPAGVGEPIVRENDRTGDVAMRAAKAISNGHPGSTVHGPHFHGARPPGRKRTGRKPSTEGNE